MGFEHPVDSMDSRTDLSLLFNYSVYRKSEPTQIVNIIVSIQLVLILGDLVKA